MVLYLVHHGDAVGPEIDSRRPLSSPGRAAVIRLAQEAARRGAKPSVVWHSGKLRARQTAEELWRVCNALAEMSAVHGLQPDDPPAWIRDRLRGESRDILIVGHFPYLPRLHALLLGEPETTETFPLHGMVSLVTDDEGESWREVWRLPAEPS